MSTPTKLNNGEEVQVIAQITIDNRICFVCKLKNPVYVHNSLISYVVHAQSEFKEFSDKIKKESDELSVIPETVPVEVKEEATT